MCPAAADQASPERLDEQVTNRLWGAGYAVKRIVRILPPLDTGCPAEVLFLGRDRRVAETARPYRASLPESRGEKVTVTAGW